MALHIHVLIDQVRVAGGVLEVDVVCKRARARQPRESASLGAGPPLARGLAASAVAGGGQAQAGVVGGRGGCSRPGGGPKSGTARAGRTVTGTATAGPRDHVGTEAARPRSPPHAHPPASHHLSSKDKRAERRPGLPGGGETELAGAARGRGPRGAGSRGCCRPAGSPRPQASTGSPHRKTTRALHFPNAPKGERGSGSGGPRGPPGKAQDSRETSPAGDG